MTAPKISFSELKVWNECPFKHKLVYIDEIDKFKGNEYTAFGTAIHAVCEGKVLNESLQERDLFISSFDEEMNKLKELDIDVDDSLVESMKNQGLSLCEFAIPELKNYFGDFKVLAVEEPLMEDINHFESYGKKFKGFIDLIIQTEDEKIHIIDWKTCTWGWDMKKRSDPMTTYQLTYYKNFYAQKHNIDPKKIETYFILLKRTAKKNQAEVVRITSGPRKTNNSLKLLENAVYNIEKQNFVKNRLSCKYCMFKNTTHCP